MAGCTVAAARPGAEGRGGHQLRTPAAWAVHPQPQPSASPRTTNPTTKPAPLTRALTDARLCQRRLAALDVCYHHVAAAFIRSICTRIIQPQLHKPGRPGAQFGPGGHSRVCGRCLFSLPGGHLPPSRRSKAHRCEHKQAAAASTTAHAHHASPAPAMPARWQRGASPCRPARAPSRPPVEPTE